MKPIRDMATQTAWRIIRTIFLAGLAFIILQPLLFMVSASIRPVAQLYAPGVVWIPRSVTADNYLSAMQKLKMLEPVFRNNSVVNTFLLDLVSALFQVFTTALAGYGFARFRFRGRSLLFGIVIMSMIVPTSSIIVPSYLSLRYFDFFGLGRLAGLLLGKPILVSLVDQPLAFYLPAILGMGIRSGLCIFIFRQFFRGMPWELEDAASIDGAGSYGTFFRVFVPNAAPALLTTLVFSIVWYWNDYYFSAMYFPRFLTVSLALAGFRSVLWTDLSTRDPYMLSTMLQTGSLLSILPLLALYLVIQRRFTESIERTGIVG